MLKCNLLFVAEKAIIDRDNSNLSIINVFDDIAAESYPILFHNFTIIAYLEKDDTDTEDKQTVGFKMFNNSFQVVEQKIKIDFRGKHKSRAIIQFTGIPFNEPGKASFLVMDAHENTIGEYSISLSLIEKVTVKE